LPEFVHSLEVEATEVMYTYIMQRTQISLSADERRVLDDEASRTGKSIAALIREAVEKTYGTSRSSSDDLVLMRQSFGTWSDRDEDGAATVERLRSRSRLVARNS
jgi:hypothetical protein